MAGFRPQFFLEQALNSNNMTKIRVALSSYITKNPSNEGNELKDAASWVEARIPGLWEPYDGRALEGREQWNETYLGILQSDLMQNFAKQRFEHILEVGRHLYSSGRSAGAGIPGDAALRQASFAPSSSDTDTKRPNYGSGQPASQRSFTSGGGKKDDVPVGKWVMLIAAIVIFILAVSMIIKGIQGFLDLSAGTKWLIFLLILAIGSAAAYAFSSKKKAASKHNRRNLK